LTKIVVVLAGREHTKTACMVVIIASRVAIDEKLKKFCRLYMG